VRSLSWILFALLALAAGGTFLAGPLLERVGVPRAALAWGPPVLLGAFVVLYAGYRVVLVRAGRYRAGKLLVQVATMLVVLAVVFRVSIDRLPAPAAGAPPVDLARPLASPDPEVRALGAELTRHRPRREALQVAGRLIELLQDPSPEVRRQAHASLIMLAGRDEGAGPGASARWSAVLGLSPGGAPPDH
jgi:hypothetical protein